MFHSAIELHDSTISAVSQQDSMVVLDFAPAYIRKSEQRPGIDAGTGWVQHARLRIDEASVQGLVPVLPADVWDGDLIIDSAKHENIIPLPLSVTQSVALHVEFCTGDHVTIKGFGASLELTGECKYIEDFVP